MSDVTKTCDLCGLSNPIGRTVTYHTGEQTYHFCCPGCRQVFIMLLEASFRESDLFKRCLAMGLIPRNAADLEKRVRAGAAKSAADNLADPSVPTDAADHNDRLNLNLKVSDMWCPACAWVIEESLKKTAGVHRAACNFSIDRVRCEYDPKRTSPAQIQRVIAGLGYRAESADSASSPGRHREFVRFCITSFFTMNVMMLSFALYTGSFRIVPFPLSFI